MNFKSSHSGKPGWKKFLIVAIVLLVAGYQLYSENAKQPGARDDVLAVDDDSRHDSRLPDESDFATKQAENSGVRERSSEFFVSIGRTQLQSPAGLIYGMGGGGEHRVDHVMRHAKDDPSRPSHGVFDGDKESILRLIDEAYEMVKGNSRIRQIGSVTGKN